MTELWAALSPWVMPIMVGLVLWGQRSQAQRSTEILTQQAVHETTLRHIETRLSRLESNQEGR